MQTALYTMRRRVSDGVAMFIVMWLSMLCLIYVAYGEATRTFERFQGDKLSGQAQIVETGMETVLRAGLPLQQFVGFEQLAEQILESDATIASLIVTDLDNEVIFRAGDPIADPALAMAASGAAGSSFELRNGARVERIGDFYRFEVMLDDKFETVGRLFITMPIAEVSDFVWSYFEQIVMLSPLPAALFAFLMAGFGLTQRRGRMPWAQIAFAIIFLAAASIVIAALISLYSEGAQAKAQALAQSLGQRLSPIIEYGLNLDQIDGLGDVLSEYLTVNPDLSSAALIVDGANAFHTDASQVGQPWRADVDSYQYLVDLARGELRSVTVAVELPSEVVLGEILRSVKNFGALFIASAFLANLFFQVGGATVRRVSAQQRAAANAADGQDWLLDYVKPVFFLGVLAEHLTYAFLPQHVQAVAIASNVSESWAMTPFMVFYAAFALTLIPAGQAAERLSPRPLMYLGLAFAGVGLVGTTIAPDFWTMILARGLAGVGQGMLFIGVQSYLLAASSEGKKTQAAAIIVYGFQGGMISGMAVGSLLVGTMGPEGVFALSAVIAFVAAIYAIVSVPVLSAEALSKIKSTSARGMFASVGKALGNRQFLNAMVSIGLPAKAVLTGVVTFGLPLLLSQALYAQEDIGQIIMIYALAVVASSQFVAPYVDRIGDSRVVLFHGAFWSGFGMLLLSVGGMRPDAVVALLGESGPTIALTIGIAMIGVAHGFINAPIVTFIAQTRLAGQIGMATTTSTYRFLERIGHVAGPVIVGKLFFLFHNDWTAVALCGAVIMLLGLTFYATSAPRDGRNARDVASAARA